MGDRPKPLSQLLQEKHVEACCAFVRSLGVDVPPDGPHGDLSAQVQAAGRFVDRISRSSGARSRPDPGSRSGGC